jgi:prepilin signal peptidase PulO-like enzyme (type II secretory pathway)
VGSPQSAVFPSASSELVWWALSGGALHILCALAVWQDLKHRRLPNVLAVTALGLGLALRIPQGWAAVGSGVAAALAALGFGLLLYATGAFGGGDAKWMAGVSSFLGLEGLWVAFLGMAGFGGAMALLNSWRQGRMRETFSKFLLLLVLRPGRASGPRSDDAPGTSVRSPFGLAISFGAILSWWW